MCVRVYVSVLPCVITTLAGIFYFVFNFEDTFFFVV